MTSSTLVSAFAEDVRHYLQLTPRQLPSLYLYDALGSALFDAICELPWYAITRAETRLLECHRRQIVNHIPDLDRIVELGPGDGRKLKTLVYGISEPLTAHLVDVSAGALSRAAHTLADSPNLRVVTHQAPFEEGLQAVMREGAGQRTLVLFLGSNIGNFDLPTAGALLDRIAASLAPGDALLIGADLVKPERDLMLAYDDPIGVSAAFNLNVLVRINRELDANFDVRAFRHHVVWNSAKSRMEMFLVSTKAQHVRIEAVDLEFDIREGEPIWTESSYKYTPQELITQLGHSGLTSTTQWIDRQANFALTLARPA